MITPTVRVVCCALALATAVHAQDIGRPLARTMMDLAIALDASVGVDPTDSVTLVLKARPAPQFVGSLHRNALRGARIGIFTPYFTDTAPEIADSARAVLSAMRAQGAVTVDVLMPDVDSVIVNSSATSAFKFDLIGYMQTIPNAAVHSLRDTLDQGRTHERRRVVHHLRYRVGAGHGGSP